MVNQYDRLRHDLQQVKDWRKVSHSTSESAATKCVPVLTDVHSAAQPWHACSQVALAVSIHGPAADDGSLVAAGSPRKAPSGGAFDKCATGEAASLEMQELRRAYSQLGHLTTASGHTLKQNPDLYLHNAGAWGLTLGCRKSVCADCCGNVPPGWRFTTVALMMGNNTLSRLYLCFRCARLQRQLKHACFRAATACDLGVPLLP
jgi:hypothetical protein